jgi:cysteine desulfurase
MIQTTDKIYFDYAATTPTDPRVLDVMLPYFNQLFGNPSSIHLFGQQAEAALESAREKVAYQLNCQSDEIIFTSCGSESDNLAIRGAALAARRDRGANHILVSPVEHHAVSRTAEQLAELHGFELEYLPVDEMGMILPAHVAGRLRPTTALVSVIYANNEIGTINPIADIGTICQAAGVPFHSDAVQAAAYLPVDTKKLNVDLLSIGAHKFYGPKGVGALYVSREMRNKIIPAQTGGAQEFGLRAGTHNIPYIIGMAEALQIAQSERHSRADRLLPLRDALIGQILELIPESRLTGHPNQRLPNHASFVFRYVDGNALLMALDVAGFACSSGSACKTGLPEPSEVLTSMGIAPEWALGSLRLTLGTGTTTDQIMNLIRVLPQIVQHQRDLTPKKYNPDD